jgi:hypothetical protein
VPLVGILSLRLEGHLVSIAPRIAVRRFDLDDVGAEIGQDHGGARRCDEAREVHDLQAREDVFVCHLSLS